MDITDRFIIICILAFFGQIITGGLLTEVGVFCPMKLTEPWRIITSMFLHGDLGHLFLNMFALFLFGKALERKIGPERFILLFFVSGIFGDIGYTLLTDSPSTCALGASGAVYGIIGALVYMSPKLPVYFYGMPLPMIIAGPLYAVFELFALGNADGVAHSAHLFGFLGGLALVLFFRKRDKEKEEKHTKSGYF